MVLTTVITSIGSPNIHSSNLFSAFRIAISHKVQDPYGRVDEGVFWLRGDRHLAVRDAGLPCRDREKCPCTGSSADSAIPFHRNQPKLFDKELTVECFSWWQKYQAPDFKTNEIDPNHHLFALIN
jgi:hypothetical protein